MASPITTAQLRSFLSTYTRIDPHTACEETQSLTKPPKLLVWLHVDGAWVTMDQAQMSKLWSKTSASRSLCHLLFRDVLRLSDRDYKELRTRWWSTSSLSGFYKGRDGSYAIVTQLKMNNHIKSIMLGTSVAAVTAGLLGGGAYKFRHKFIRKDDDVKPTSSGAMVLPTLVPTSSLPYDVSEIKFKRVKDAQPKARLEDYIRQANTLPEVSRQTEVQYEFKSSDFDVDMCKKNGVTTKTALTILIFYVRKILSDDERQTIYVHPKQIEYPSFAFSERIKPNTFAKRREFHRALNEFLETVPLHHTFGVAYVYMDVEAHASLLIFDVKNERLEFYDPNGRTARYTFAVSTTNNDTFYDYLVRNRQKLHAKHDQVCKIWAPVAKLQNEEASCSLWTTVIAMCRMSGIDRGRLPTDIQTISAISRKVREVLLETCLFSLFQNGLPYTDLNIMIAVDQCVVPSNDIKEIRDMIMANEGNDLLPIPPDIDVCAEPIQVEQAKQPILCSEVVTIDTYANDLNLSELSHCNNVLGIIFKGPTHEFPTDWFKLTNRVVFEPRFKFVSLNHELTNAVGAMIDNSSLRIETCIGIVNLSQDSIVQRDDWNVFESRLRIARVLIFGELPADEQVYTQNVNRLKQISTPYMLLSPEDSIDSAQRKLNSPIDHYAVPEIIPPKNYEFFDTKVIEFVQNNTTQDPANKFKEAGLDVNTFTRTS